MDIDNCTIAEIISTDGNVKHGDDNIDELLERFILKVDNSGWRWICRRCSKPAYSSELYFECRQCFVTVKVVCHLGCHSRWHLEIKCSTAPQGTPIN